MTILNKRIKTNYLKLIITIVIFLFSSSSKSSQLSMQEKEGLIKVVYASCIQAAPIEVPPSKAALFCSCYTDAYVENTTHEELTSMISVEGEPIKKKQSHVEDRINKSTLLCNKELE